MEAPTVITMGVLLVIGAFLRAPGGSNQYPVAEWFAIVPLLVVIRYCRPQVAAAAGLLWGVSLFGFCVAYGPPSVQPIALRLLVLGCVPTAFCGFGAWLTRTIGFSPIVLGVGWMVAEMLIPSSGLAPFVPHAQGSVGTAINWICGTLGYAFLAFLVGYLTASFVAAVDSACVCSAPLRRIIANPAVARLIAAAQVLRDLRAPISSHAPRAPPRPD